MVQYPEAKMAIWFLILLACLIVGFGAIFARAGKRGRLILGLTGLGLVFVGILPLVAVRSVAVHNARQTRYYNNQYHENGSTTVHERSFSVKMDTPQLLVPSAPEPPMAPQPAAPEPVVMEQPASASWTPSAEGEFLYDVYPSAESAATALARTALRSCDEFSGPEATPVRVDIVTRGAIDELVRDAIQASILAKNLAAEIVWQDGVAGATSRPTDEMRAFRIELQQSNFPVGGKVEVSLAPENGPRKSYLANYVDKGWVEDPASIQRLQNRQGRSFLVACSNGVWATADDARRQAKDVARQQIQQRLASLLLSTGGRDEIDHLHGPDFDGLLAGFLDTHATISQASHQPGTPLIADEFVQRADRNYGQLWRTALLVDVSRDNLNVLSGEVRKMAAVKRAGVKSKLLSTVALLLAVTLVYALLQAATRGYYVWTVRLLAVVMLAGGVLVLTLVA